MPIKEKEWFVLSEQPDWRVFSWAVFDAMNLPNGHALLHTLYVVDEGGPTYDDDVREAKLIVAVDLRRYRLEDGPFMPNPCEPHDYSSWLIVEGRRHYTEFAFYWLHEVDFWQARAMPTGFDGATNVGMLVVEPLRAFVYMHERQQCMQRNEPAAVDESPLVARVDTTLGTLERRVDALDSTVCARINALTTELAALRVDLTSTTRRQAILIARSRVPIGGVLCPICNYYPCACQHSFATNDFTRRRAH